MQERLGGQPDHPPSEGNGDGDYHVMHEINGELIIDPTPMSKSVAETAAEETGGIVVKESVSFDTD